MTDFQIPMFVIKPSFLIADSNLYWSKRTIGDLDHKVAHASFKSMFHFQREIALVNARGAPERQC